MGKAKSLHLTDRSMSIVRETDSLSARFNQIADRYIEMVRRDRENVRGKFTAQEWAQLVVMIDWFDDRALSAESRLSTLLASAGDRALRRILHDLTGGELIVLLELLENDEFGEPPATHSQGDRDDSR